METPREPIFLPPGEGRVYPMGSCPGDFEVHMPDISGWFAKNPPGRAGG